MSDKDLLSSTLYLFTNSTERLMSNPNAVLGECPQCGQEIPQAYLLIEYEMEDGEAGIWAECPECADVVDPNT
jgi:hypothetical protein